MASKLGLSDAEKVFVEALAGAIGGFAGAVSFYPLDTIKTRIQAEVDVGVNRKRKTWKRVFNDLVTNEGYGALFAGVGAKGAHSMTSSFLYFLAFSSLKRKVEQRSGRKIGIAENLTIAMLAGCVNVLVTEPLDTLSTRRQICGTDDIDDTDDNGRKQKMSSVTKKREDKKPEGTRDAFLSNTYDQVTRGLSQWASLYSGIGASMLLTINPAIQYTCFEQARTRVLLGLRRRAEKRGSTKKIKSELTVSDAFVLGAASKAIATFLTYPLVRAKVLAKAPKVSKKISKGGKELSADESNYNANSFRGKSLLAVMRLVVATEGASGLYKGLHAQLLKTVLAAAFSLTVKEKSWRTAMLLVVIVKGM